MDFISELLVLGSSHERGPRHDDLPAELLRRVEEFLRGTSDRPNMATGEYQLEQARKYARITIARVARYVSAGVLAVRNEDLVDLGAAIADLLEYGEDASADLPCVLRGLRMKVRLLLRDQQMALDVIKDATMKTLEEALDAGRTAMMQSAETGAIDARLRG